MSEQDRHLADEKLKETAEREFGVGLDREGMSGTGGSNTGTGPDFDFEQGPAEADADDESSGDRRSGA